MSPFRWPLLAVMLTAGLILATVPAPPSRADAHVVSPSGSVLQLDAGKGLILRLDKPAASVFVADPAIADIQVKSPTVIYLIGKSAGETTIYAVDASDNVLLNSRIDVHQDVGQLEHAIQDMVPGTTVQAKSIDNSIVLQGTVRSAAEGDDIRKIAARFVSDPRLLVNKMQIDGAAQINLHVRVAEVSRSVIKAFGVNFENNFAGTGLGLATGSQVINGASGSGAAVAAAGGATASAVPGAAGVIGSFFTRQPVSGVAGSTAAALNNLFLHSTAAGGAINLNTMIDALEQQGLVTILAEPNLTAVSGQKASFLAGGEFPVPVPQTGGAGSAATITIDWKKYGVALNFTATVLANDRINLHVEPEVSQLSSTGAITIDGFTVPALETRHVETTVELGSGQAFAIGGLMQNNVNQNLTKFPWLGDLPVLGPLFRSSQFQRNESELVVIVTPYLVQPVSVASSLKTPVDGFVPASDIDRNLHGALNEARSSPTQPITVSAVGPSPFVPQPNRPSPMAATPIPAAIVGPRNTVGGPFNPALSVPGPTPPRSDAPVGAIGFELD